MCFTFLINKKKTLSVLCGILVLSSLIRFVFKRLALKSVQYKWWNECVAGRKREDVSTAAQPRAVPPGYNWTSKLALPDPQYFRVAGSPHAAALLFILSALSLPLSGSTFWTLFYPTHYIDGINSLHIHESLGKRLTCLLFAIVWLHFARDLSWVYYIALCKLLVPTVKLLFKVIY